MKGRKANIKNNTTKTVLYEMLCTSLHVFWILNHFLPKRQSVFVVDGGVGGGEE